MLFKQKQGIVHELDIRASTEHLTTQEPKYSFQCGPRLLTSVTWGHLYKNYICESGAKVASLKGCNSHYDLKIKLSSEVRYKGMSEFAYFY